MSEKHQLPCQCGQTIEIRATQAGELVACASCGHQNTAPTMREIRQLPKAESDNRPLGKKKTWRIGQGILFASGLAIAVIGIAGASYFGWYYFLAQKRAVKPDFEDAVFQRDLSTIDLVESWKLWASQFRDFEFTSRRTPDYIIIREFAGRLGKCMMAGIGAAIFGSLIAASAFLMGGSKATRAG